MTGAHLMLHPECAEELALNLARDGGNVRLIEKDLCKHEKHNRYLPTPACRNTCARRTSADRSARCPTHNALRTSQVRDDYLDIFEIGKELYLHHQTHKNRRAVGKRLIDMAESVIGQMFRSDRILTDSFTGVPGIR